MPLEAVTFDDFVAGLSVGETGVRSATEREHFPHEYTKAPHVTRRRIRTCRVTQGTHRTVNGRSSRRNNNKN